jgi:hypothetical protein
LPLSTCGNPLTSPQRQSGKLVTSADLVTPSPKMKPGG